MSTQYKRIAFHTLGCKLNFSETATISRDFIRHGFEKVDYRDKADFYVLNTCSVTENANKEARKLIRQAKRRGIFLGDHRIFRKCFVDRFANDGLTAEVCHGHGAAIVLGKLREVFGRLNVAAVLAGFRVLGEGLVRKVELRRPREQLE